MKSTATDGHRWEVQLAHWPASASHAGDHHVVLPSIVGGDVEEDGKAKTSQKEEKPKKSITNMKMSIADVTKSMDGTPASKFFSNISQSLERFFLLRCHLSSDNVIKCQRNSISPLVVSDQQNRFLS